MKGIIAEIDGGKMIVLTKNGDFINCKRLPNSNIGDEVKVPSINMISVYKKMSAVAASFLLFAMLSSGVYAYYTPYSYVSVDINPSLELSVNRFEKVIGVHAFNEDAEKVLAASADIKNKEIDEALQQILNEASDQGYLKQEESNSVMLVVSSNNQKEEALLTSRVSKASTEVLAQLNSNYEVILEKTEVEKYKEAKKNNISPGKVILADRFKEVKPDIDEEKIRNMPLKQAILQIEKKEEKDIKPDKPLAITVHEEKQPKEKINNRVKNVKELIIEKNEDLGKKLINKKDDKENDKDKKENETLNSQDSDTKKNDKDQEDHDNKDEEDKNSKVDKQQPDKGNNEKNKK